MGGNNAIATEGALAKFEGKQDLLRLMAMEGGLDAMLDAVRQFTNTQISENEKKLTKVEMQEQRVLTSLEKHRQFIRVKGLGAKGRIYTGKDNNYSHLTELDRDTIIKEEYKKFYNLKPSASNIKRFGESLEAWVDDEREGLNDNIIMITDGLYWDLERMEFVKAPDPKNPCFRRLFDSRPTDDIKVDRKEVSKEIIKVTFKQAIKHLNEYNGEILLLDRIEDTDSSVPFSLEDFYLKPFWTWANEDVDMFNDLLKSVAANFMYNKPKGAFILIGRTRNGKSSFIKMLHTLFGSKNTSEVRLSELTDPHLNMTLMGTMLNAPDEEDEGKSQEVLRAQGYFKMLSTHKALSLPVYYSQDPQPVPTNFMSYHPMNDVPEWRGTGAEACMRRSLILMFEKDLSKMDNNGRDFEKETYTAQFYSHLLGVVLAIAKYYNNRPFSLSEASQKKKKAVAEEVDNISVYLDRLFAHFPSGYQNAKLVFDDYKLWCDERGLVWLSPRGVSSKLKARGSSESRFVTDDGETISINRIEKGRRVFHSSYKVPQLGEGLTVGSVISGDIFTSRKARSVIGWLDVEMNKKQAEEAFDESS